MEEVIGAPGVQPVKAIQYASKKSVPNNYDI